MASFFKLFPLVALLILMTSCKAEEKTDQDTPSSQEITEKAPPPLPDTLAGSFLIAQFAERDGDPKHAYAHAQAVLTLGGYDASMIRYARYAALLARDLPGALKENARLKPEDRDAPFYVLSFFENYKKKDWDQAATFLPTLASNATYQSLAPFFRGWLSMARHASPEKNVAQDQILAEFVETEAGDLSVLANVQRGYALILLNKPGEALKALQASIADLKSVPVSVLITTAALMQQENQSPDQGLLLRAGLDPDMTETIINMAKQGTLPLLKDPTQGVFYLFQDLSSLFNRPGSQEDALMYALLAHTLMPDNAFSTLHLAQLLKELDALREAEALYRRIPETNPLFWIAQVYQAHLKIKDQKNDEALAIIAPLHDRYPNNLAVKKLYADLLKINQRFSDALPLYDALIKASQGAPDGALYYSRGVCYERLKQWEASEKDLLKAIALNPEDPMILNYLAYSWIDRGVQVDQGIALLEKALTLAPNSPEILDSLAWGYHKKGENEKALLHLEKAVMLSSAEPVILSHYGDVLWAMGKHQLAEFAWKNALEMLRLSKNASPNATQDITEEELLDKLAKVEARF
jgi:tetratricopeptide (TPR) repeat protein